MSSIRTPLTVSPHEYFGDITGRPLDYGTIYFGEPDKDPEFYPIDVYSDEALTQPIPQPIRTKGGFINVNGDIIEIYGRPAIYSVKVLDQYGRKIFYKGKAMRNNVNDDIIAEIDAAIQQSKDDGVEYAKKAVRDAINKEAIEGGEQVDTFVVATPKFKGAVARTQAEKNNDTVSLLDFIPADELVNIKLSTSTYDCSAALAAAVATGKRVIVPTAGTYKFVAGYNGTTDFDVEATTTGVVFDFDGSLSSYPISNSGSITKLELSYTPPDKGDFKVDFTSVTGINVGDWLCFYCPTDFSYSQWRAGYRAGEWVKVREIAGNTVYFEKPFTDSLVGLTLELYKLNSVVCRLKGVKLVRTDKEAGVVKFSLSSNASDTDVVMDAITNSVIYYDRCVEPISNNPKGKNKGRGTDDYAISFGNCQSARVYNPDLYSRRHAIALGGGNEPCSVPITDFRCYGGTLNADPAARVGGADMHGNVRNSSYENCTIYAGANIGGGDDNWYKNCIIYPDDGGVLGFTREIIGGSFGWVDCKIHINGSPRGSSRGLFDIGGSSSGLTDFVKKDVYANLLNTTIVSEKGLDTVIGDIFLKVNVRGCDKNVNIKVDGVTADCEVTKLYSLLFVAASPAMPVYDTPDTVIKTKGLIVDNITNIPAQLYLASQESVVGRYDDESIPMRIMSQSAKAVGVVASGSREVLTPYATFPITYPKTPTITSNLYAVGTVSPYNEIGGKRVFNLMPDIQKNRSRIKLVIPLTETFTEDTFVANWSVGINDI